MRTIATALALSACVTLAGCESLPDWFQPTTNPDGTTSPSAFEDTVRTAGEVAPAFGPGGIIAGVALTALSGLLELGRRKERAAKDRVADGLRVVAGAIDSIKTEDKAASELVVDTVKRRATPEVRETIDHVRGKTTASSLKRANV